MGFVNYLPYVVGTSGVVFLAICRCPCVRSVPAAHDIYGKLADSAVPTEVPVSW